MNESDLEKRLEQILHSVLHPLYSSRKQIVGDENAYVDRKTAQILTAIKDAGYSNTPYGTGEFSFTEKAMKEGYMTGQEFYQRFEKELKQKGTTSLTRMSEVKEAAKRAAGIDER